MSVIPSRMINFSYGKCITSVTIPFQAPHTNTKCYVAVSSNA